MSMLIVYLAMYTHHLSTTLMIDSFFILPAHLSKGVVTTGHDITFILYHYNNISMLPGKYRNKRKKE